MGMVTDIKWECPKCGTENIAQLYGDYYLEGEYGTPLSRKAIPSDAGLKWNPPCEGCGKYRLAEPPSVLVEFPLEVVSEEN